MKLQNIFYFLFWLLVGILAGTLIGNLCGGLPGLSWLALGQSIRFTPAFDLAVLAFSMDFSMTLNLAQVICIAAAMFVYHHFWF